MSGDNEVELTEDQCWELLAGEEFGRLAFRVVDEQHITPINYCVDGNPGGRRSLLFRTASGTKLLGVLLGAEVAFEIDDIGEDDATSVVVRGHARRLEEDEAHRVDVLPLRPWVDTAKYDVVEILPSAVTGRRFSLHRPWRHLRVDTGG
jgi:uncharacterized protein